MQPIKRLVSSALDNSGGEGKCTACFQLVGFECDASLLQSISTLTSAIMLAVALPAAIMLYRLHRLQVFVLSLP